MFGLVTRIVFAKAKRADGYGFMALAIPAFMQDTKAHRQIPLSMILDALEYDLPAHRNVPSVTSPSATSPPVPSSSSPDDGDATHRSQTFKIVTTKRTLLLCAPSEEEEIKWLSAIRALIAR